MNTPQKPVASNAQASNVIPFPFPPRDIRKSAEEAEQDKQNILAAQAKAACFRKFYLGLDEFTSNRGIPAGQWLHYLEEYAGFAE